jgi:transposase
MIAGASPAARLLTTIPLVSERRACLLDAAIGDVGRFPTADHLVKYCGVAPGHRPQSGQTEGKPGPARSLTLLATELQMLALAAANPKTGRNAGVLRATYERVKARTGDGRKAMWAVKRQAIRLAWGVLSSGQPHRPRQPTAEPASAGG